jgi:hypothetical protein
MLMDDGCGLDAHDDAQHDAAEHTGNRLGDNDSPIALCGMRYVLGVDP